VARDPQTGRFGIAVQSHFLGVGPVVPWLEAGVGAVATQASVNTAFGPIGLELLRAGSSAEQTVAALLAGDEQPQIRQVGVVDARGRAAAHTGTETIPAAGHLVRDGFTVQGNLLLSDTCWPPASHSSSGCCVRWRRPSARGATSAAGSRPRSWWWMRSSMRGPGGGTAC
jgi:uncharacterized Ntn-hydrolase superfamily protein